MKKAKFINRNLFLFALLALAGFSFPRPLDSANLTSASNTLETSRLSFHGKNFEQLTAGTSIIKMATSGTPSVSTSNIFPGDTVVYTATSNTYTVDYTIDADEFAVTAALDAADDDANDEFVIDRTATHTVAFTTTSAIADGAIKVRIKADDTTPNDGHPDNDGWDFNSIAGSDVACPGDVATKYDFVTATATASAGSGCAAGYHCFECRYSGPGNPGESLSMTIGADPEIINPAPASGHTVSPATADTYSIIIDNLNASNVAVDSTTVKVAVIESVRVTASVDPTISFSIAALNVGSTACGNALDISSTATTVPFGSLSLGAFVDLAQNLTVSTNADGGYVVTTIENNQLARIDAAATEIADTPGDTATATHTVTDEWVNTATKGFGYSIENVDATTPAFQYSDSTAGCDGVFCAKQFAATADGGAELVPVTIFSSGTVADGQNAYVCYRAIIGATQEAGDYWNAITYRATATF
ncbi:hypothetical protein ISS42_01415 [Candidatus Shapirobacteria bacterium]|nr:hypothetical protein [Candidatus Shapirobacteria bacterium]